MGHERKTVTTKTQLALAWREFALSRAYRSRRVLWSDGSETRVPEIPAYREADNVHLTFFCSECFHWHRHGAGEFTGDGDGHRSAHCSCPWTVGPDGMLRSKSESAFAETGYWLREVGLFTAEVAAQFPQGIAVRRPSRQQFWPEGSAWPAVTSALKSLTERSRLLTPEWHEGRFCCAVTCSSLKQARADQWPVPLTDTGDHWDPQDADDFF